MEAVNRYVDYINARFSGTVSHVNHGTQTGFGVEWTGLKHSFAGTSFQWINAESRGSNAFSDKTSSFHIDLDVGAWRYTADFGFPGS